MQHEKVSNEMHDPVFICTPSVFSIPLKLTSTCFLFSLLPHIYSVESRATPWQSHEQLAFIYVRVARLFLSSNVLVECLSLALHPCACVRVCLPRLNNDCPSAILISIWFRCVLIVLLVWMWREKESFDSQKTSLDLERWKSLFVAKTRAAETSSSRECLSRAKAQYSRRTIFYSQIIAEACQIW